MAKVRRQVPHPDEIFELLKFKKPDLNLKHARLEKHKPLRTCGKLQSAAPHQPRSTTPMVQPTTKFR